MRVGMFSLLVFGKICSYTDKKSILQLRQVCKTMNEYVSTFVATQSTTVRFYFSTNWEGKIQLQFYFSYRRNIIYFWKLCFISVLRKLSIDPTMSIFESKQMTLVVILLWKDMKRFLASMKPIFANGKIIMSLAHARVSKDIVDIMEVIHEYSEFFKGKTLLSLRVSYPLTECAQMLAWHTFIRKVDSERAEFEFEKLDKESAQFLLEIANRIESIIIWITESNSTSDIQAIIVTMLKRKCRAICIRGNTPLTSNNVEKLLQFANRCDKKVDITANYRLDNSQYHVGDYKASGNYRKIIITHAEIPEFQPRR